MARLPSAIALVIVALLVAAPPAGAPGWVWPVRGEVITPYRNGDDPYAGGQHREVDIAAPVGAAVVAARSGVVRFAGAAGHSGLTLGIRTADGRYDTSCTSRVVAPRSRSQRASGSGRRAPAAGRRARGPTTSAFVTRAAAGLPTTRSFLPRPARPRPSPSPTTGSVTAPARPSPAPTCRARTTGRATSRAAAVAARRAGPCAAATCSGSRAAARAASSRRVGPLAALARRGQPSRVPQTGPADAPAQARRRRRLPAKRAAGPAAGGGGPTSAWFWPASASCSRRPDRHEGRPTRSPGATADYRRGPPRCCSR